MSSYVIRYRGKPPLPLDAPCHDWPRRPATCRAVPGRAVPQLTSLSRNVPCRGVVVPYEGDVGVLGHLHGTPHARVPQCRCSHFPEQSRLPIPIAVGVHCAAVQHRPYVSDSVIVPATVRQLCTELRTRGLANHSGCVQVVLGEGRGRARAEEECWGLMSPDGNRCGVGRAGVVAALCGRGRWQFRAR
jgi:hypothetical protein